MTRANNPLSRAANTRVQGVYNQIGPLAFAQMRASRFSSDNRKNALQWKMKGSRFTSIRIECQPDGKSYQVSFFIINHEQFTEIVIERVNAGELTSTIERMTGLRLSSNLSPVFVK